MCLQETSPVQRLPLSKCHKKRTSEVQCPSKQVCSALLCCLTWGHGKGSEGFLNLDTIPATTLGDKQSHTHSAVPATTLYQEPPKSAIFAKCSKASYQPGFTAAQPLGVKAPPPKQLYRQPSPLAPSPHLADFTQGLYYLVTWESQNGHSDLSSLPTRLAAPRRPECSSQLGGEPHPQVSVPETPRRSPLWAPAQLETLARCLATGPLRASLPGYSVIDVTQVLHKNKRKQHQTPNKPLS